MVAIILAGGMGTRLRSVTKDQIPKVMAEVKGKPFIYWQLRYLKKQGIKKSILAVHFHADQILSYLGNSFEDMELVYSFEQKPLGTGGAIRQAMELVPQKKVLILNGDTWFPVNLKDMNEQHDRRNNQVTLALKKLHDFDRYGSVILHRNNQIEAFVEKKKTASGYINGGIYIIESRLMDLFDLGKAFSIERDLFETRLKEYTIGGYKSTARFIDIGIPSDYYKIQSFKLI